MKDDDRYKVIEDDVTNECNLIISNSNKKDAGIYEAKMKTDVSFMMIIIDTLISNRIC